MVLPRFTTPEESQHSQWAHGALCRHRSAEQRSWDSLQICAGETAVSERPQIEVIAVGWFFSSFLLLSEHLKWLKNV